MKKYIAPKCDICAFAAGDIIMDSWVGSDVGDLPIMGGGTSTSSAVQSALEDFS
ncbi:MAG: hypothetical protein J6D31_01980 [Clostridia bacterium]|nr:hypothetical protein [Clostridia bacterium]